jgi:two-component system LytT family response regulator
MMIRAVLADDEVLARQRLRQLLRDEPEVDIVGECATAPETIELVRATGPELLFLDIRMPGMDGFDVVGALSASKGFTMPSIIFTTAYDQYALRAFEMHAVDYLLKPFTSERLHSAVARLTERDRHFEPGTDQSNGSSQHEFPYSKRLVFKSRGRIIFLPVSDIRWIGAEENYVRICTEKENHLLRENGSLGGKTGSRNVSSSAPFLDRQSSTRKRDPERNEWGFCSYTGERPKSIHESQLSLSG